VCTQAAVCCDPLGVLHRGRFILDDAVSVCADDAAVTSGVHAALDLLDDLVLRRWSSGAPADGQSLRLRTVCGSNGCRSWRRPGG